VGTTIVSSGDSSVEVFTLSRKSPVGSFVWWDIPGSKQSVGGSNAKLPATPEH
jgi:hypothetical protein